MGIYIKGIEMPTGNHEIIIRIQSDGRVLDQRGHRLCLEPFAIPVPPHGRLIDADDVNNHIHGWVDLRGCPTIIPASGGE